MLPVTIYCYEINFIVTSKSRALIKQLIVMDQLWHLVRWVVVLFFSSFFCISNVMLRQLEYSRLGSS